MKTSTFWNPAARDFTITLYRGTDSQAVFSKEYENITSQAYIHEECKLEKCGFFNSSSGDRVYDASDFASYLSKLVSNGIFYINTANLQVKPGTGMTIQVLSGSAWINGYYYENTSALELTAEMASGLNPRIDRVVIRWSAIDRNIALAIKTGAAQSVPVAPALTRNSDVYELIIVNIAVEIGILESLTATMRS